MPTGGFKILDTAEVKMSFSGYTMFLGNNTLASHANDRSSASQGWFSRTFSGSKGCAALAANESRSSDRANLSQNHICTVALPGPTQVAPSHPTSASGSSAPASSSHHYGNSSSSSGHSHHTSQAGAETTKFDPEIITVSRTHRIQRDACALAEIASVNAPMNSPSDTASGASSTPTSPAGIPGCARVRDVETLVLTSPGVAVVGLYNNIATLFAAVDPASAHPKATSDFQRRVLDSDKLVPLQSVRFAVRCTAFATFTTHSDFAAATGLSPTDLDERSATAAASRGPFSPPELWTVFGFGSGDIVIWSHAQEAMLKRHNNTSALSRDADKNRSSGGGGAGSGASADGKGSSENGSAGSPTTPQSAAATLNFVEPGVAVNAIARVERGSTEPPTCLKWQRESGTGVESGATTPSFNSQVTTFCDLVVGYDNGMILVVSLNATGGFVNQKLSGWFGFSGVRALQPCPVAPHLLAAGFDDGSVRFLSFPWSFDTDYFEGVLAHASSDAKVPGAAGAAGVSPADLTVADIGTTRDPRVLCKVPGAVSGGGVTCISWSGNGEAVVVTGEDDSVSIVSLYTNPPALSFAAAQRSGGDAPASAAESPVAGAGGAAGSAKSQGLLAMEPIAVKPITIHRRGFNRSWCSANMVLSLDVVNVDPRTEEKETRKVTCIYTAALDGAVVAGAAFPASELAGNRRGGASPAGAGGAGGAAGGGMERNSSIPSSLLAVDPKAAALVNQGLAIRQRPLARFLQMARSDTVINFAPVGTYHPEACGCIAAAQSGAAPSVESAAELAKLAAALSQRKRSFVTITAKGTVAMWVFYDILTEEEEK